MRFSAIHFAKSFLNHAKLDVREKEWFVNAPWGKMAVVAWGDSTKQPILLCHGRLDSAATFRPLIKHMPQSFHYVSFDLPGNGKSDPFPKGLPVTIFDFVYSLKTLVDNLSLDKFGFIGHSLGSCIGRYYNLSYPKHITRLVDIDPIPAFITIKVSEFPHWYKIFQQFYEKENYLKLNSSSETSPKYTYDKVFKLVKDSRGLTEEATSVALERILQPAGDGLFQLTFDQRQKVMTIPPFSTEYLQEIYTSISEPILTILVKKSVDKGAYSKTKFIFDKSVHKSKNYFVETVEGNHDVHLCYPERITPYINKFLTTDFDGENKSKT